MRFQDFSRKPFRFSSATTALATLSWLILSSPPVCAGRLDVIARTGMPLPDGNGFFGNSSDYSAPCLGDHGTVLFSADVIDPDPSSGLALVLGRPEARTVLARIRQYPPALAGVEEERFVNFGQFALSGMGVACFSMVPRSNSGSYGLMESGVDPAGYGLRVLPGASSPVEGSLYINSGRVIHLNDAGDAVFSCSLDGTDGGTADNFGVFTTDTGSSLITAIAQNGDPVPSTALTYNLSEVFAPTINPSGQVAMVVSLVGGANGAEGILRGNGSSLELMAGTGDPLPGGDSIVNLGPVGSVPINASGAIATGVNTTGNSSLEVVVRIDGAGSFTEVARVGAPVDGIPYTFRAFERHLDLNDSGAVSYAAAMTPDNSSDSILQGIFLDQTLIAFDSQQLPDGNGVFEDVDNSEFSINASGQVVFQCNLVDGGGDKRSALFLFTPGQGVEEIVREGDPFIGSSITEIDYSGTNANNGVVPDCRNGFNDNGQVAFGFSLADGRAGIALWSPGAVPGMFSTPRLTRTGPASAEIEFTGFRGVPFTIDFNEGLDQDGWSPVVSPFLFGTSGQAIHPIGLTGDRGFYRLQPLYHRIPYSN